MNKLLVGLWVSIVMVPLAQAEAVDGCQGTDVRVTGSAKGCIAVVVLGEAEGRYAVAGSGKAAGGTIAFVGSGCATQSEEGIATGIDNTCGRSPGNAIA